MNELLSITAIVGIITSGIRLATPYLFASLGEMFAQRSGVVNLGVEGIMLMGAFMGYYAVLQTGNPWLGLFVAMVTGALMGLLDGRDQRHDAGRAGDQRHRPLAVWPGTQQPAHEGAGGHADRRYGFPAAGHSGPERHPRDRPVVFQLHRADLPGLCPRAGDVVCAHAHHIWAQGALRGAKPGSGRLAGCQRRQNSLRHGYSWRQRWPASPVHRSASAFSTSSKKT